MKRLVILAIFPAIASCGGSHGIKADESTHVVESTYVGPATGPCESDCKVILIGEVPLRVVKELRAFFDAGAQVGEAGEWGKPSTSDMQMLSIHHKGDLGLPAELDGTISRDYYDVTFGDPEGWQVTYGAYWRCYDDDRGCRWESSPATEWVDAGAKIDHSGGSGRLYQNCPHVRSLPVLLVAVQPRYPAEAGRDKVQGYVTLQATITVDGKPVDIVAVKGEPPEVFDENAIEAFSKWRFVPACKNGQLAPERVQQTIEFKLGHEEGV